MTCSGRQGTSECDKIVTPWISREKDATLPVRRLTPCYCLTLLFAASPASGAHPLAQTIPQDPYCGVEKLTPDISPHQVLLGTEVEDLSAFHGTSGPLLPRYETEIGGATLSLSITHSGNDWRIQRTYREPGTQSRRRTYSATCHPDGLLMGDSLKGMLVQEGLLIEESQSDVEGIPNNMWVLYRPDFSKNARRKLAQQSP